MLLFKYINDSQSRQAALMLAVERRTDDIAAFLLDNGSSPNEGHTNYAYDNPLTLACRNGDIHMVEQLLSHGADPYYKTRGIKDRPIDIALELLLRSEYVLLNTGDRSSEFSEAKERSLWLMRRLLDHDDGASDPNGNGMIALLAAVYIGDLEKVKKLVERGVPANQRIHFGYEKHNCLMVAYTRGDIPLTKILLEHGADPYAGRIFMSLGLLMYEEEENTLDCPIAMAISRSDTKTMKIMLEANDGRTNPKSRCLAMLAAFILGETELVDTLANIGNTADGDFIKELAYIAIKLGTVIGMDMLLNYDSDINMEVLIGLTPPKKPGTLLELAIEEDLESSVTWLLENGADANLAVLDPGKYTLRNKGSSVVFRQHI
jgi:ankyrin repeat protein